MVIATLTDMLHDSRYGHDYSIGGERRHHAIQKLRQIATCRPSTPEFVEVDDLFYSTASFAGYKNSLKRRFTATTQTLGVCGATTHHTVPNWFASDVINTTVTQKTPHFTTPTTVVRCYVGEGFINHCTFYFFDTSTVDYNVYVSYNVGDYLSIEPMKVEDKMARNKNDDLLIEDELAAAFLNDETLTDQTSIMSPAPTNEEWSEQEEDFPGQLAVDVYETEGKLVIKARTAGVNKEDLDVSISDGILTISGTLNSGDESQATGWHIQECYWGEFNRTLALPVSVKEDEVEAVLKDGVLTISFSKIKQEAAKRIQIQ
jgi:HSP20 family protein